MPKKALIQFPKGTIVKIDGLPFFLPKAVVLEGSLSSLSLIDHNALPGTPIVLKEAQLETSEMIKPSL